jgi:hypothetical protein
MDWLDDLIDHAEKIKKAAEDGEEAVEAARTGRIDAPSLERALDRLEVLIEQLLDPAREPSLDPPNAGAVDVAIDPDTLAEYASDCVGLAGEALDELATLGTNYDADYVGTRMKTILHLIRRTSPHNYRSLAGV